MCGVVFSLAYVARAPLWLACRPCGSNTDCSGGLQCDSFLAPAQLLDFLVHHDVLGATSDADACGGGLGLLQQLQVLCPLARVCAGVWWPVVQPTHPPARACATDGAAARASTLAHVVWLLWWRSAGMGFSVLLSPAVHPAPNTRVLFHTTPVLCGDRVQLPTV